MEALSLRMERRLGITAQQRLLLRCVGKFPGITPGQLAELLCLDRGTVSATTRRLSEKGLLMREAGSWDRRRALLGLSVKGRRLDQPLAGTVESAVEKLLAQTPACDIAVTARAVERLIALLDLESPRKATKAAG